MNLVNDDLATKIEARGYAIVRGLFNTEEITLLRTTLENHFSKKGIRHNLGWTQPNAAIEVDDLGWLYSHSGVLEIFRRALRTDDITFTGHCDAHDSMLSRWHKDSGEHRGSYFQGDYFNAADCKVYKMAVYLEDHDGTGTGLSVRERSHHTSDPKAGEANALNTRAGDIIIFDVRLTHMGQGPDFFERALISLNSRIIGRLSDRPDLPIFTAVRKLYSRLKGEGKRLSIFFTYGYPNAFTEQFSESNMARQLSQTNAAAARLTPKITDELKRAGVRVFSGIESGIE